MRRLGNHILFWLGYVLFKTYLNITSGSSALLSELPGDFARYSALAGAQLTFLVVKIPLVYLCFSYIDRFLDHRYSSLRMGILIVVSFAGASVGMALLNHFFVLPVLFSYHDNTAGLLRMDSLLYHFFTLVFVAGVASSLRLLNIQYQSRLREVRLQKEKTETEFEIS